MLGRFHSLDLNQCIRILGRFISSELQNFVILSFEKWELAWPTWHSLHTNGEENTFQKNIAAWKELFFYFYVLTVWRKCLPHPWREDFFLDISSQFYLYYCLDCKDCPCCKFQDGSSSIICVVFSRNDSVYTLTLARSPVILPADQLISNLLARIGDLILAAKSVTLKKFHFLFFS